MKKINLKGISEILSSKELKNVFGGSVSGSGSNPGGGWRPPSLPYDCSNRWNRPMCSSDFECACGFRCVPASQHPPTHGTCR